MPIELTGGKRFGFEHPSDYLDKLEWEYQQVMKAGFSTGREIAYHFMNFAITAWHMADWIYPHLPTSLGGQFKSKTDFARWAKQQERMLAACHVIANASKHFELDNDKEPTVELLAVGGWDVVHNQTPTRHSMAIAIDGKIYGLDVFASSVVSFWQNYLESIGL